MAITDSREVVIEATPDEIMDVLFDIESLTEWSSAHKKVEVLESLRDAFAAEGNEDLFQFRYGEAKYEADIEQFRYLFLSGRGI